MPWALESTVHSAQWNDLKRLKAFITRAANDVKDKTFWKRLFVLLRALFPLLKLLRCADSNKPNMDKVGKVTTKQVREIAEQKMPDLNCDSVDSAMAQVVGSARSMGLQVVE